MKLVTKNLVLEHQKDTIYFYNKIIKAKALILANIFLFIFLSSKEQLWWLLFLFYIYQIYFNRRT